MSLARQGLRGLARSVLSGKALPQRAGAGAPFKRAAMPDKPLPCWYELWWENGVYPGQPAVDYMVGPLPANLTPTWYAKVWAVFGLAMALPIYYTEAYSDEFRMPYVPIQYPPEVRDVLLKQGKNNNVKYDFSQPDYDSRRPTTAANIWSAL